MHPKIPLDYFLNPLKAQILNLTPLLFNPPPLLSFCAPIMPSVEKCKAALWGPISSFEWHMYNPSALMLRFPSSIEKKRKRLEHCLCFDGTQQAFWGMLGLKPRLSAQPTGIHLSTMECLFTIPNFTFMFHACVYAAFCTIVASQCIINYYYIMPSVTISNLRYHFCQHRKHGLLVYHIYHGLLVSITTQLRMISEWKVFWSFRSFHCRPFISVSRYTSFSNFMSDSALLLHIR